MLKTSSSNTVGDSVRVLITGASGGFSEVPIEDFFDGPVLLSQASALSYYGFLSRTGSGSSLPNFLSLPVKLLLSLTEDKAQEGHRFHTRRRQHRKSQVVSLFAGRGRWLEKKWDSQQRRSQVCLAQDDYRKMDQKKKTSLGIGRESGYIDVRR